jgi:hypothetical protein
MPVPSKVTSYSPLGQLPYARLAARLRDRLEVTKGHRPLGFAARVGEPDDVEIYLTRHEEVVRAQKAFAAANPRLALSLVALDGAYQRARAEVAARGLGVPHPSSLSGSWADVECLAALRDLLDILTASHEEAWARAHVRALQPARAVVRKLTPEVERGFADVRRARANALGPALEIGARALGLVDLDAAADGSWADAVVHVDRAAPSANHGSGVVIRPNAVITAGHVVLPIGAQDPSPEEISVTLADGSTLGISEILIHPRWRSGRHGDSDWALLVTSDIAAVSASPYQDFGATGGVFRVGCYGYPVDTSVDGYREGKVSRGGPFFVSPDIRVPSGCSGGGMFYEMDGDVRLVGITTRSEGGGGGAPVAVGLPMPGGAFAQLADSAGA